MSKNISFALSLFISTSMITSTIGTEAYAQETTLASDVQILLPGQSAIADGKTQITYYFMALKCVIPRNNLRLKISLRILGL